MESRFLAHLMDVSLRSLPLAAAGLAVLRAARLRSAAQIHAVWTTLLLGMFLLFFCGPWMKPLSLRILPATRMAIETTSVSMPPVEVLRQAQSESASFVRVPPNLPATRHYIRWSDIAMWVYAALALALLSRLLVGAWLTRRLLAGSVPVDQRFHESHQVTVPLTVGLIKPRILLPCDWRKWSASELEAILMHENSHINRRDSAIALLAGINRCLLWFHPLAWWIEAELALLAEQACDEACVSALKNRRQYARLLLEMAADVEAAGGRTPWHALAMAKPSQVHRRIDAILGPAPHACLALTRIGWVKLLFCGIPVIYAAGTIRIESKPAPPQLVSPAVVPPAPLHLRPLPPPMALSKPVLLAQAPAAPQAKASGDSNLVLLPVSVLELAGRSVTGLDAGNFQVSEGQNVRPIVSFGSADGQHAVALVKTAGESRDAVDAFQNALDPRDESFVTEGPPAKDTEAFWDGIAAAVMQVKQTQNPLKAVVVMMQGGRANAMASLPAVSRVLRLALRPPRVAISFANIEDITEPTPLSGALSQQDDMRILAGVTGGQVIPVARAEEMATALQRIAVALRHEYLLGINPPPDAAVGAVHRLSIELVQPRGFPPLRALGPQAFMR